MSDNISTSTKISVHELCVDGESLFQIFIDKIIADGNFKTELFGAIGNLELAANLVRLPETKFREIKAKGINVKLYEAKYRNIRIYHFQEKHTGRIIVCGGIKSNQTKDIKSAINTIKNYHNERQ